MAWPTAHYGVSDDELHVRYRLFDTSLIEHDGLLQPGDAPATLLNAVDVWLTQGTHNFSLAHRDFQRSRAARAIGVLRDPDVDAVAKLTTLERMRVLQRDSLAAFEAMCGAFVHEPATRGKRQRLA